MRNSRHAIARRRRTPIDGTVVYKRRMTIDGETHDVRLDKRPEGWGLHGSKPIGEPSYSERMRAAGMRGLNPDALAISASGWDQDN